MYAFIVYYIISQDYLICIEMFVASIAFSYAFTYRDYQSAVKSKVRISFDVNSRFNLKQYRIITLFLLAYC